MQNPTLHRVKEEIYTFIEKSLENSSTLPPPAEVAQSIIAAHPGIEGKDADFIREAAAGAIIDIVESLYTGKTAAEVSQQLKHRLKAV
jgi:hypothetical protein